MQLASPFPNKGMTRGNKITLAINQVHTNVQMRLFAQEMIDSNATVGTAIWKINKDTIQIYACLICINLCFNDASLWIASNGIQVVNCLW